MVENKKAKAKGGTFPTTSSMSGFPFGKGKGSKSTNPQSRSSRPNPSSKSSSLAAQQNIIDKYYNDSRYEGNTNWTTLLRAAATAHSAVKSAKSSAKQGGQKAPPRKK